MIHHAEHMGYVGLMFSVFLTLINVMLGLGVVYLTVNLVAWVAGLGKGITEAGSD